MLQAMLTVPSASAGPVLPSGAIFWLNMDDYAGLADGATVVMVDHTGTVSLTRTGGFPLATWDAATKRISLNSGGRYTGTLPLVTNATTVMARQAVTSGGIAQGGLMRMDASGGNLRWQARVSPFPAWTSPYAPGVMWSVCTGPTYTGGLDTSTPLVSGSTGATSTVTELIMGGGGGFLGDVVVWPRVLSAGDMTAALAWFAAR